MPATDFGAVFEAHHAAVLRLAYLLVGDRTLAEDLTADAFARTYPRWRRGRIDDVGAYLRRAVVNGARSWGRRDSTARRYLPRLVEPDVADDLSAERDRLWWALGQLSPRQRAVLVLRYYEDRSEAEIAALLGVSRGTVKTLASRGLARMRDLLEREAR